MYNESKIVTKFILSEDPYKFYKEDKENLLEAIEKIKEPLTNMFLASSVDALYQEDVTNPTIKSFIFANEEIERFFIIQLRNILRLVILKHLGDLDA